MNPTGLTGAPSLTAQSRSDAAFTGDFRANFSTGPFNSGGSIPPVYMLGLAALGLLALLLVLKR